MLAGATTPDPVAISRRLPAAVSTVPGVESLGLVEWLDDRHRAKNQTQWRAGGPMPERVRLGPRLHRPNVVLDRRGRAGPIDQAVGLLQPRGPAGQRGVLRHGLLPGPPPAGRSSRTPAGRPTSASRASNSAAVSSGPIATRVWAMQGPASMLRGHVDHGHAGLRFAVIDGPIDRRRAAVLRQQRGVQVHAPETCRGQRGRRQDLPVVADHQQIGPEIGQSPLRLRRIDVLGIEDFGVPCCRAMSRIELIGSTGLPRWVRSGAVTNAATAWRVSYSAEMSARQTAPCPA